MLPAVPLRLPSAPAAIAGLVGGIAVGLAAFRWPGAGWEYLVGPLEVLGAMWLAALQMLALPLIISVLIVAIGRAGTGRTNRLGAWSVGWCTTLLAVAAAATVLASRAVLQAFPIVGATRLAFQTAAAASQVATQAAERSPAVQDWFVHLVPSNLATAAARGELLPLIVATLLFGAALRHVPAQPRDLLLATAQAMSEWCYAVAGLLFTALPLAVFALTLSSTARSGTSIAAGLAYYVFWVSALLVAGTLALYPVTARLGRVSIRTFARAVWPVQMLAFSTRSSVACLPAMLAAARGPLALPDDAASFALPFAVSTFKLNVGISANFQMLFLLHVYGLTPDPVSLALAVAATTMQSVATPGLPSGAVWTTTPIYLALGIPLEGIVLTNVVDAVPDLFKTTANVTADLSVAAIVAKSARPVV